jgi:hypothetical protein
MYATSRDAPKRRIPTPTAPAAVVKPLSAMSASATTTSTA